MIDTPFTLRWDIICRFFERAWLDAGAQVAQTTGLRGGSERKHMLILEKTKTLLRQL